MLLKEIKLRARHPSALHHFYKEILELPTAYSDDKNITVTAGKSILIFEEADVGVKIHFIILHSIFPPTNLKKHWNGMGKKLNCSGWTIIKVMWQTFVNWHAKSFYFMDPAGNILELISRFDLNDIANEKIFVLRISVTYVKLD